MTQRSCQMCKLQEANAELRAVLDDILTAFDEDTILHPDRKGIRSYPDGSPADPNYSVEFVYIIVRATAAIRKTGLYIPKEDN